MSGRFKSFAEDTLETILAAMTLAPLREARARGYAIGTLSPSEMGLRIYRRIGFREYCQIHIYAFET
jgi:predicted acetyltransferase